MGVVFLSIFEMIAVQQFWHKHCCAFMLVLLYCCNSVVFAAMESAAGVGCVIVVALKLMLWHLVLALLWLLCSTLAA